jgi:hypothetical protein
MTFEPHPKEFFSPDQAPPRILNLRDKLAALAQIGIDRVVVEHFNAAFARLTPEEFVSEIIVKRLNAKWILIGDDFCYGAKRAGNFESLKAAGEKFGFEVSSIHTVQEDGERISSSALRNALANGNMDQATKLLGRPYGISGHVIHGQKLGRTLGFPTLNLAVANHLHHRKPAPKLHQCGASQLGRINNLGIPSLPDLGRQLRASVLEPLLQRKEVVCWKNYEASYDVAELEAPSRDRNSFVLQEYFIPVARFDEFVPKMRDVFKKHKAKVFNVSIRHALPDTGSLLAWASEEVFAFVVYYEQGTSEKDREEVAVWTREMIDQALSVGGRYYLPYQIHATDGQFRNAYPGFDKFFELKRKLDPENNYRNRLWDRYYQN